MYTRDSHVHHFYVAIKRSQQISFIKTPSAGTDLAAPLTELVFSFRPDVYFSQRNHHGPRELHPVHHPREFRPALAGDPVQHVHLRVPLPPALGHHDLLLHADPGGDLQPHGQEQPWVGPIFGAFANPELPLTTRLSPQWCRETCTYVAPTTTSPKPAWGRWRWASWSWRRSSSAGLLTTCSACGTGYFPRKWRRRCPIRSLTCSSSLASLTRV